MSIAYNNSIVRDGLTFYFDAGNTKKSWRGAPTTNLIVSTPLTLSLYAYASGPVTTTGIVDHEGYVRTVRRYTVTNVVNTARAAIYPTGLSAGINYAFSYIVRYNGNNTASPSFYADASKGQPEGGANNNSFTSSTVTTTALGLGWYYIRYTFNFSSCPTGACVLAYGVVTGSDSAYLNNTFDIYNEQFELSSFATPYVSGVRSNTQAILDLTNSNTVTANSLTYNSDNTFSFNGSTNNLSIGNFSGYSNNVTCESVFKTTSSATWKNIVCGPSGDLIFTVNGNVVNFGCQGSSPIPHANYSTTIVNTGNWFHAVATYDGVQVKIYINGILESTNNRTGSITSGSKHIGSASGGGSEFFNGDISFVRIYNRALTATEVLQNFNAQRGQYGI